MNRLRILLSFFSFLLVLSLQAQEYTTATEQVTATIRALFDGMRASDSAMVAQTFHPEARLMSAVYTSAGVAKVQESSIERFVQQIGSAPKGALNEQIAYYEVRITGPLATAYTPYVFIYNGDTSHCGVNTFQLVATGEEALPWQILQITDTRERENCGFNKEQAAIEQFLDNWHSAAANADEDTFFGSMAEEGIYIGTDATERWLRDDMATWAAKYFERETAWDFTPYDRNITFDPSTGIGHWDELLETWMGPCRGSGVFQRGAAGGYEILHYHLSVTIPNEQIQEFIKLTGAPGRK